MARRSLNKTDFWVPLLDIEWEVLHRAYPDLKAERRDNAWWLRVTSKTTTREEATATVRQLIAEELAGHGLDKPPPIN